MPDERDRDTIDNEDAADLPDRNAMSLLDPGALLGGGGLLGSPTSPTATPGAGTTGTPLTGGAETAAPGAVSFLPPLPNLPHSNPDGAYTPDTSTTSQT